MVGHTHKNRGSIWRKWDLHIHSPLTFLSNEYKNKGETVDQFVNKIVASEISVIGLTNYFRFDERELTEIRDKLKAKGIVVFPNIELRINQPNKDGETINLHILFSNKTPIEKIRGFLFRLRTIKEKYCFELSSEEDFLSEIVGYDVLFKALDDDVSIKHLEDYLIVACPRGLGGFRPSKDNDGRGNTLAIDIDKLSDILFGNADDIDHFLRTDRYKNAKQKPVFHCSDAHELKEIGDGDSWVKAETTFEGLKQTLYDPQSRVRISDQEPVKPNNVIDSITFNVPADATVSVKRSDGTKKEEQFCFAKENRTYYLSPFFNCFIGGRGSGKSTILNFLGLRSNNPEPSQKFWNDIKPNFAVGDPKLFSINGTPYFEFIGQNQIEKFATDEKDFTNAIYERANIFSGGALKKTEEKLTDYLKEINGFQTLIYERERLLVLKESKLKERKMLKTAADVVKSRKYSEITQKITNMSNKRQNLKSWRGIIDELRLSTETSLARLQQVSSNIGKTQDDSVEEYIKAFEDVKARTIKTAEILDIRKFEDLLVIENDLTQEISTLESELHELLKEAGLSEENIVQSKVAPQKIVVLDSELLSINSQIEYFQEKIGGYRNILYQLASAKREYEEAIQNGLKPLVDKLDEQAKFNDRRNIQNIKLNYFFDEKKAWGEIATEFYSTFSSSYVGLGERPSFLKEYILDEREIFAKGRKEIEKKLLEETSDAGYIEFLRAVFDKEANYQIFRTIRDRHLNNAANYKRVQVLYDGKDIERASFGQRCTAVLVILLLFGNYPLIIDEPEAHLDSSLIANYLVPLIKNNKNTRQIIFATHNANFVINGDAEKIFILKNETGTTEITETTIENLNHRDELLTLEGGKEAFIRRGEKLHIHPSK